MSFHKTRRHLFWFKDLLQISILVKSEVIFSEEEEGSTEEDSDNLEGTFDDTAGTVSTIFHCKQI